MDSLTKDLYIAMLKPKGPYVRWEFGVNIESTEDIINLICISYGIKKHEK